MQKIYRTEKIVNYDKDVILINMKVLIGHELPQILRFILHHKKSTRKIFDISTEDNIKQPWSENIFLYFGKLMQYGDLSTGLLGYFLTRKTFLYPFDSHDFSRCSVPSFPN